MITNEERRNIAAKLRKEAERHFVGFDPLKLMECIGIDIDNEPFFDGWHRYPELITFETWNRLADLIEPERICKQVLTECNDGLIPPFTAHCSECGDKWGYTPNYCPNCGARVQS
jgi:hypothetical protein